MEHKTRDISILGTKYTIRFTNYNSDKWMQENSCEGYCDSIMRQIVICDMRTWPNFDIFPVGRCEQAEKNIMRHEIIHAFFNESGLQECTFKVDGAWSKNEEMVDWLAIQYPKIKKVFRKLGCEK